MVMNVSTGAITYRATAIKARTLENLQRNELQYLMEVPVVPAWSKLYSH